jgi:hypothetical protein
MNLNINLPHKKVEMFALFLGAVLIASPLSNPAFFLIQHKLPPPGVFFPFWLAAWPWLFWIYLATQVHNTLLRVAISSLAMSMAVSWLMSGNEGMASWFIHVGFQLLAGVLMVIVGVRKNRCSGYLGALLLLVALAVLQYLTAVNWARDLEIIRQHQA